MKPFSIHYGISPVYAATIICCFFLFTAQAAARDAFFQIQTPPHWHNRTDRLEKDLKQQVMAPGKDAFIEVYAVRSGNIGGQGQHGADHAQPGKGFSAEPDIIKARPCGRESRHHSGIFRAL